MFEPNVEKKKKAAGPRLFEHGPEDPPAPGGTGWVSGQAA